MEFTKNPSSSISHPQPPILLDGRYQKVKRLGKGSYGKVYQVIDKSHQHHHASSSSTSSSSTDPPHEEDVKLAIKILTNISTKRALQLAYREMYLLRHLQQHPAIIPILDAFAPGFHHEQLLELQKTFQSKKTSSSSLSLSQQQHQQAPEPPPPLLAAASIPGMIAMEFSQQIKQLCLGFQLFDMDLRTFLQEETGYAAGFFLTDIHTQFLLFQLLCGLHFIHSQNIIHRDIKPANVLLNRKDTMITIADFGFARVMHSNHHNNAATTTSSYVTGSINNGESKGTSSGSGSGNPVPAAIPPVAPGTPAAITTTTAAAAKTVSPPVSVPLPPPVSTPQQRKQQQQQQQHQQGKQSSPPRHPHHDGTSSVFPTLFSPHGPHQTLPTPATVGVPTTNANTVTVAAAATAAAAGGAVPAPVVPKPKGLMPKPLKNVRGYTQRVITRYYRAPEVILCESYNASVDVWSIGCIFAELLACQDPETIERFKMRKVLFPGSSSAEFFNEYDPDENEDYRKELLAALTDRTSQIGCILHILGTPCQEDLVKAFSKKGADLLLEAPHYTGKGLASLLPRASSLALDLLNQLLSFIPSRRISVIDALNHPYFDDLKECDFFEVYLERVNEAYVAIPEVGRLDHFDDSPPSLVDNIIQELLLYR